MNVTAGFSIRLCLAGVLVSLSAFTASTQERAQGVELRAPLDVPLTLAGNFGELRRNHFHSGVDFKTQGRTGLPVYAVDDGYVSRATVSPWGFGRALYITHPSTGLTTVYGHLEAFSPEIDRLVRNRQYADESFTIDMEFKPGLVPVKRGQQIARSGNAGSSGGPHLHFDVRDTRTGDPLDPLEYYRTRVKDNVAPEVRKLALYPAQGGTVEGDSRKASYRQPGGNPTFTAWGEVVPGIKAYDRMTDTRNIYGVKYLTLMLDSDTIYRRVVDRYSFDNTRAVHTIIDNADLENNGEWIMTTRVPQARPLPYMIEARDNGVINIDSTRIYNFKWILEDEHGNRTVQPFTVKGERKLAEAPVAKGQLMLVDADNVLETEGLYMEMPEGALYDNTFVDVTAADNPSYLSKVFNVGNPEVPLDKAFEIYVPVLADTVADKSRYCLVRINAAGKRSAEAATYTDGAMKARLSRFGRYAVTTDNTPPVITPLEKNKWGVTKNIRFKITDNLSGIESWRGEIDGKWALFELDGKTATLWFKIDPDLFPGKNHEVKLTVTDACGNTSTYTAKI